MNVAQRSHECCAMGLWLQNSQEALTYIHNVYPLPNTQVDTSEVYKLCTYVRTCVVIVWYMHIRMHTRLPMCIIHTRVWSGLGSLRRLLRCKGSLEICKSQDKQVALFLCLQSRLRGSGSRGEVAEYVHKVPLSSLAVRGLRHISVCGWLLLLLGSKSCSRSKVH